MTLEGEGDLALVGQYWSLFSGKNLRFVPKVTSFVARHLRENKFLKGCEKSVNLGTKALKWQHCL